jgi:hypothetical protein
LILNRTLYIFDAYSLADTNISSNIYAALLEIIGLPLFISGYATPAWMVSKTIRDLTDISIGLWKVNDCSSGSCNTRSVPESFKNGKCRELKSYRI